MCVFVGGVGGGTKIKKYQTSMQKEKSLGPPQWSLSCMFTKSLTEHLSPLLLIKHPILPFQTCGRE